MLKYLSLLCVFFAPYAVAAETTASTAPIQRELGIVAVVNDEVVTSMDVADRVAFIVATTRLPNTQDTVNRLIPQVSRQLIDEKIQLQEARRLGIKITPAEIGAAIEGIAARQNLTKEQFYTSIASKGLPKEVLEDQVKAQLSWQQVIRKEVRPNVKVSDAEIERARLSDSLKLSAEGAIEVQTQSLILPVRNPSEEAEIKELATELVDDLRKGAAFEKVAAQFGSQGTTAPSWQALSDIDPSLAEALSKAVPGSVSNPARILDGYVVIKLLGRRGISSAEVNDSQLMIKNILLALDADDEADMAQLSLSIAKEVARNPGDCQSESVAGIHGLDDLNISVEFIEARFSELSKVVQNMVANLSVGAVSEAFATPEGIRVLMLCERTDAPPQMATAEATYAQLMNKKMTLETQKYIRNLRRDAFIEFRR